MDCAFWDDEEFCGDQFKLTGEFEEAGIKGRFGFGLLKGFAMVKISMGKDSAETSRKRREVPVGCLWDRKPDESIKEAQTKRVSTAERRIRSRPNTYLDGKALGEFKRAVALSTV